MEYLDIMFENGITTGLRKERSLVHRDGDPHGTSHVWIVRPCSRLQESGEKEGTYEVLLQKRSRNKDAYPGCYDISSAGHIPAGEDYLPSAIREMEEELGIKAAPEDLLQLGMIRYHFTDTFHGKLFDNHEISTVYLYLKPVDEKRLRLQEEEVEEVCWMEIGLCLEKVQKKDPQFCIIEEELRMVIHYLY